MDKVASRLHHSGHLGHLSHHHHHHHHQHQHSHQHPHNHIHHNHHNHNHVHNHNHNHNHHHNHAHIHQQFHARSGQQEPLMAPGKAPVAPLGPAASAAQNPTAVAQQLGSQLQAAQSKRKEKARIAARARRSQEASIIMEMANELHISQDKIRRIDKATIVKLAIDYIKAFDILCRLCTNCCPAAAAAAPTTTTAEVVAHTPALAAPLAKLEPPSEPNPTTHTSTSCITPTAPEKHLQQQVELRPAPKLSTGLIFAPKTDDMDSHFLMIEEHHQSGRPAFVLKPDAEILAEDDLTHLAPQAGDASISLEVEPLDNIVLDTLGLFAVVGLPAASPAPASPPPPRKLAHSASCTGDGYLVGTVD